MNRMTSVSSALLLFGSIAAFAQPEPPPAPPGPPRPPRASRVVIQNAGSSFLGVGVSDIDSERAKALNLKEERGVEVKNVDEDSPAAKAGVKVADVVLEYTGQRVEGTEQFVRFVRETPVGRQARLTISRGGSTQTVTAAIGSRPSNMLFVGNDDFKFRMPDMRIPDIPRAVMSWQSRPLGVESESLRPQLAEFFGVKEGVLVRSVIKGSAAEKAGMKAGDVITRIGDKKVANSKDISGALRSVTPGKAFPVTVVRDKKETSVNATIEEKSSGSPRPAVVRRERQDL